jgi:8-oxo-dGTP pyrophosphatase MutT (NUDIX family)
MNLSKKTLHRPSILYQAAALPWRCGRGIEVMLITSLGTRRWVLPKGTLRPDETARAAAKREALEEAGIEGTLDMRPLGAYHYEKSVSAGNVQLCSVDVFGFKVTGQLESWREQDQRRLEWFALEEAAAVVNEDDLRQIILSFDPARKAVPRSAPRMSTRVKRRA